VELYWQGKAEVFGEKRVPVTSSTGLAWDWTRSSAWESGEWTPGSRQGPSNRILLYA